MAINPLTKYPTQVDGTDLVNYPYGKGQNVTTPGDGTGTPWEIGTVNDILGLQQALLSEAGIVPSGSADTATVSQYLEAIKAIIGDLQGVTEFESAEQALPAANTSLTVVHGLGASPKWSQVVLRCKVTEYGYAVGDEILLPGDTIFNSANIAYTYWQNATELGFRSTFADFRIARRDAATYAEATAANWRVVFKAWK